MEGDFLRPDQHVAVGRARKVSEMNFWAPSAAGSCTSEGGAMDRLGRQEESWLVANGHECGLGTWR